VVTVSVTIMTITGGGLFAVLTVIVTITGRFICRANSYCDNNDYNRVVNVQF